MRKKRCSGNLETIYCVALYKINNFHTTPNTNIVAAQKPQPFHTQELPARGARSVVAGMPPPAALLAVAQVTHSSVTTNKASTRKRNLINSPSKKRFPEARGIARFLRGGHPAPAASWVVPGGGARREGAPLSALGRTASAPL